MPAIERQQPLSLRFVAGLVRLLESGLVVTHPMIIGELALGSVRHRVHVLSLLGRLPVVPRATDDDVLTLVDTHRLHGSGLSLVDAHLLASARISSDVRIWTRDRRLSQAADVAGVHFR